MFLPLTSCCTIMTPMPSARRFIQYLEEVFLGDRETISIIQEVVGYSLHKSLPVPAMFFLEGDGSNGKSVFINVLTYLVGDHNTSSVASMLSAMNIIELALRQDGKCSEVKPLTEEG